MKKIYFSCFILFFLLFNGQILLSAETKVSISASNELVWGGKETFSINVQLDNAPSNSEVFIILTENDTGNYWAASIDSDTNKEWIGSTYNVSFPSGIMHITKTLIPMQYNSYTWNVIVRDKTNTNKQYASSSIDSRGKASGNLSFTASPDFEKGEKVEYKLSFKWDNLPEAKEYELFYILIEGDTGKYWAGAQHYSTKWKDWTGDTVLVNGTSGSLEINKKLIVFDYKRLTWAAQIRDKSDAAQIYATSSTVSKDYDNFSVASNWYLAEGCTNGFDTWILIQNPNDVDASCKVTFMPPDGNTVMKNVNVPARSRYSMYANDIVPNKSVSTMVESTNGVGVIVERAMYWDADGLKWAGGHCSIGVTETAYSWYLAEGSTAGSFSEFILIQNPNNNDASCKLTFMKPNGNTVIRNVTVPATGRFTINVGEIVPNESVSTKVESLDWTGIIVERSMYWDALPTGRQAGGLTWAGGHCSVGVTETSSTWYLAEGSTEGSFSEFVLIQNPNFSDSFCKVTFMKPNGNTVIREVTVPATGRYTINVNDIVPNESVSTKVESINAVEVIAERAMYWDAGGLRWAGGHCSIGVTETSILWYLAEGTTAGSFDEFILLQNPNSSIAECAVIFMKSDGSNQRVLVDVPATGRYTVYVNDHIPGDSVSTKVESQNGIPIIAERSMYWTPEGESSSLTDSAKWFGGHCSRPAI